MKSTFREHYSQKFCLKLDHLPTSATDRLSKLMLFFSGIFGILFFILGTYLLNLTSFEGSTDFEKYITKSTIKVHSFVSTETFGWILLILGAGIVVFSVFYDIRFKKISFDGENITAKDYPVIGKPHSFTEKLSNYSGVRLRLKFCQSGLISRNKFIVELYHQDPEKIVPLYISTNPKRIRTIWKEYALKLNLPPLHISEKGMVSHNASDMDRSFSDVVKSWNLPKNFLLEKKHSRNFVCKQKNDKKMIKVRHAILDLYSSLNILTILLLGSVLAYAFFNHDIIIKYIPLNATLVLYALALTLIIYAYLTLIVRDIMLIHKRKIIIFRKILGFAFQDTVIPFTALRGIDIFLTPTTGRYAINLITERQVTTVFSKLSPDDLRWIKGFLICEMREE
ncbi:MAG TPA: hypothetical protein DIC64_02630 [Alphaproteobacteria bacterium]|nr:hypothetical protein [Alphaproteobacteria bacterium]